MRPLRARPADGPRFAGLSLYFDGDELSTKDTPARLELEDGDLLEVHVKA